MIVTYLGISSSPWRGYYGNILSDKEICRLYKISLINSEMFLRRKKRKKFFP